MTDEPKQIVHIDLAEQIIPEMDESIKCPDHPDGHISLGYGLAGGGMGPYTYCDECGRLLSKSQDAQYE